MFPNFLTIVRKYKEIIMYPIIEAVSIEDSVYFEIRFNKLLALFDINYTFFEFLKLST